VTRPVAGPRRIAMTKPSPKIRVEHLRVGEEEAGERLDRFLVTRLPEFSRARIQELIAEGHVLVAGRPARSSHKVVEGESAQVEIVSRPPLAASAEDIPLDILYEDDGVIVVNKPANMVVHAGAGHRHGTLVNALLNRFGNLATISGAERPGIVHRLDIGTSGAIVVARTDAAHRALAAQFLARQVGKIYLALVHGRIAQAKGDIDLPVARDLHRRTRMTTKRREGRAARTDWRVLSRIGEFTLLEVQLHSGRTHQIRVHMSAIGHPIVGDTVYGAPRAPRIEGRALPALNRPFLHSARITFAHPATGKPVTVRAPLDPALRQYLDTLASISGAGPSFIDAALREFL
jgi:23S rRNA pseudouridine1911/1915/1917 synthase